MKKVRELLTESRWCKGFAAVNKHGDQVTLYARNAVRRCLIGWIEYCYELKEAKEIQVRVKNRLFGTGKRKLGQCLSVWNDSPQRKFAEVKALVEELDI